MLENIATPSFLEGVGTLFFGLAVLHTFCAASLRKFAHRFPNGSLGENFFHLAGEVEVVFGIWATALFAVIVLHDGSQAAYQYMDSRNYTEALFVFAIMTIAATRPILDGAAWMIRSIARLLPLPQAHSELAMILFIGPLLGSFITEPASMTVCALLLRDRYFRTDAPEKMKYSLLATLFVNVSIGGVLTHFAAPPVLMVAAPWGWDTSFMLTHFGYKAVLACAVNTVILIAWLWKPIAQLPVVHDKKSRSPAVLILIHLIFLGSVVLTAHHASVFMGILLFFMGFAVVTKEYQTELKIKESLLVAYFLAGLVVLGGLQAWWISPVLTSLSDRALYFIAIGLTAFTDNAALTYLGTLVQNPSASFQYALVSGAVVGGGLTVIANAPNPVGFSILQERFDGKAVSALGLLRAALVPTLVALLALGFI